MTELTVINRRIGTGVTAGTRTGGCRWRGVVHCRATVFDRLGGVTDRAIRAGKSNVLMAGGTVVVNRIRRRVVHDRATVAPLAGVAGGTIQRRLSNTGVAVGAIAAGSGRGQVMHCRTAIFRLVGVTGGAVQRQRIDILDAGVAETAILAGIVRGRVMELRNRRLINRAGVTGLTGGLSRLDQTILARHRVDPQRVTIKTTETIVGTG